MCRDNLFQVPIKILTGQHAGLYARIISFTQDLGVLALVPGVGEVGNPVLSVHCRLSFIFIAAFVVSRRYADCQLFFCVNLVASLTTFL